MRQVKRRDVDKATLVYVLARILDLAEPALLERISKGYAEKVEVALNEIVEAVDGEFYFYTDEYKPHHLSKLKDKLLTDIRMFRNSLHQVNGRRGIDVFYQECLEFYEDTDG